MKLLKSKIIWLGLFYLFIVLLLSSCTGTRMLMMTAPAKPKGDIATPKIVTQSTTDWESEKLRVRSRFEAEIYGALPKSFDTSKISARNITQHSFNANIEEVVLKPAYGAEFTAVILTPINTTGPLPIIMMENFCPNHNVVPVEELSRPNGNYFDCSGTGFMSKLFGYFFGRYITTPPIDMIMDQGFALAVIHPPENYPDNSIRFEPHRKNAPSPDQPWGAIGAWAYQFSSLSNYLDSDGRYSSTIAYGHSRYGKSALLSAAFDTNIDGVISHQSGTGGASLSKNKKGETVTAITEGYPHWFAPNYSEASLSIDQHHLLALIAPRPLLLGNAKRDVWSDPEGAFKAAQGASSVYKLYGSEGLKQSKLTAFDPTADISFWMRSGTHGVVKEDWPAFLKFMNAHFK